MFVKYQKKRIFVTLLNYIAMELDTSVSLSLDRELEITSELGADAFAAKVLSCMPEDVKSGDLGCGRILADYSIMMQTRYVLCDIYEVGTETVAYEEGLSPEGRTMYKYRIEVKSGKRSSRIGDAVYCVLFLLIFWFLRTWSSQGFNPLFLVLSGLCAAAALYLFWSGSHYKFGPSQSALIADRLSRAL